MYSFSNLELFNKCPKAWKFKYIEKLKPVIELNSALEKGSKVHLILEHYEEFLNGNYGFWYSEYQDNILESEEVKIVQNFANSNLGKDILSKPSRREEMIMFDEFFKPFKGERKDCNFVGYIDRINISQTLELIDYKTGKYKEPQYQNYDQLIIYSLYMFQKYNIEKIKIRFVYVEHNLENSLELSRDIINFWISKVLKNIKDIEEEKDYKPKFGPLCPWCSFVLMCKPQLIKNRKDFDKIKSLLSEEYLKLIEKN